MQMEWIRKPTQMQNCETAGNGTGFTITFNTIQHTESLKQFEPTITVNGQKLKVVDTFTDLGSALPSAIHIDDEGTARIAKISVDFGRLHANVRVQNGTKPACIKYTLLWYCQSSYYMLDIDSIQMS